MKRIRLIILGANILMVAVIIFIDYRFNATDYFEKDTYEFQLPNTFMQNLDTYLPEKTDETKTSERTVEDYINFINKATALVPEKEDLGGEDTTEPEKKTPDFEKLKQMVRSVTTVIYDPASQKKSGAILTLSKGNVEVYYTVDDAIVYGDIIKEEEYWLQEIKKTGDNAFDVVFRNADNKTFAFKYDAHSDHGITIRE